MHPRSEAEAGAAGTIATDTQAAETLPTGTAIANGWIEGLTIGSIILGVGFSRVYFGVHFPSDVLGGFAAGFGWLGLTSLSHTAAEAADND